MSRQEVQPDIAERVLGHVQGGVEGIYDRHAYLNEKADALLKVDRAIHRILGIDKETAKILQFKQVSQ